MYVIPDSTRTKSGDLGCFFDGMDGHLRDNYFAVGKHLAGFEEKSQKSFNR
jgi:hypothetical protein